MNMRRWENQISQILNLGDVATDTEAIKACIVPCSTTLKSVDLLLEWANNTHVGSKVWVGRGAKLAVMRDILVGAKYVGVYGGQPFTDINVAIENNMYAQVVAISTDVQNHHRAVMNFEIPYPYLVHIWEPFDFDPKDTTIDWDEAVDSGCTLQTDASVCVDNGQSLHVDTDADAEYAYMSKTIPTITLGTGEDVYLRCFVRLDKSSSAVTATTVSTSIAGNSPILCGAVNSTTYGVLLRLRGVQADTDTHHIDFNFPTTSGLGTIAGTTDLEDDKWYLAEGIISAGKPGEQSVVLNTYLLAADGTIGAAVNEGSATTANLADKTLTSTGKWGDHNGSTGKSQMNFYVDQVLMMSKRLGR